MSDAEPNGQQPEPPMPPRGARDSGGRRAWPVKPELAGPRAVQPEQVAAATLLAAPTPIEVPSATIPPPRLVPLPAENEQAPPVAVTQPSPPSPAAVRAPSPSVPPLPVPRPSTAAVETVPASDGIQPESGDTSGALKKSEVAKAGPSSWPAAGVTEAVRAEPDGAATIAAGAPTAVPGAPTAVPGAPTAVPGAPTAVPGVPPAVPGVPTGSVGVPTAVSGVPAAVHSVPAAPEVVLAGGPAEYLWPPDAALVTEATGDQIGQGDQSGQRGSQGGMAPAPAMAVQATHAGAASRPQTADRVVMLGSDSAQTLDHGGLEPQARPARRFRVLLAVSVAAAVLLTTLAVAVPWLLRERQPAAAPNPVPTPVAIGELPPPLVPSALASPSAVPSASTDAASAQPSVGPTTPRSTAAAAAAAGGGGGGSNGGGSAPSYGTPAESEEFTGGGLDKSTWGEYEGAISNGARWTPDLVAVTGGELQVMGAGRSSSGSGNAAGGVCWRCTGGAHTYGVWQLRARFDTGVGYDPVIGLGPAKGEMSTYGWITLVHTFTAARTSASYLVNGPGSKGVNGSSAADYTAWHTYTIEWRSNFVKMYRDNTLMIDTTGRSVTPPSVPMYMFIQMEAGPSGSIPGPNSSTPDRVTMHVDWVKYFG